MTDTTATELPFVIYVGWGESPEDGDTTQEYRFATLAERKAFVLGVAEGWGHADHAMFDTPMEWNAEDMEWEAPQA